MSISPTDVSAGLHLELPSALSLGQIVKARVLKHYEGGRYLVSLEGRERVVDSSVPLSTGELVRGRIIAVGDRIELQPLPETPFTSQDEVAGKPADAPTDQLGATFAQFGLQLDDATRAVVLRALKGAADPQATVLAAMTIAKLGLPQQPELIDAVQTLLRRRPGATPAAEGPKDAFPVAPGPQLVAQLQEALRSTLAPSSQEPAPLAAAPLQVGSENAQQQQGFGSPSGNSGEQLGQRVLNTQTGGAVSHRAGTLPLLLGGRLVEVDVALFDQGARQSRQGEARSRHLVFLLNSASLGGVEVSARLVDSRLRLRFAAERESTLELLAGRRDELSRRLAELGWTVDEIAYEPRQDAAHNAAYRAVADYVVAQGSLDRRI
jgi:hypothetical protein